MNEEKRQKGLHELTFPDRDIKERYIEYRKSLLLNETEKSEVRKVIDNTNFNQVNPEVDIGFRTAKVVKVVIPSGNWLRTKIHPRPNREYKSHPDREFYDSQLEQNNSYGAEVLCPIDNRDLINIMTPLEIHEEIIREYCNNSSSKQIFYVVGNVEDSKRRGFNNIYPWWIVHESDLHDGPFSDIDLSLNDFNEDESLQDKIPDDFDSLTDEEKKVIIDAIANYEDVMEDFERLIETKLPMREDGTPTKLSLVQMNLFARRTEEE